MFLSRVIKVLYWIEDAVLVALLLIMIIMATSQIVMRNFFETGIFWSDILVRNLVLWIGLLGAMVASRNNEHISIDLVTRYLPQRAKQAVNALICLFTSGICGIAAFYSFRFVKMEMEYGGIAFASIPVWICETIIPFSFVIMCLRYMILFFNRMISLVKEQT